MNAYNLIIALSCVIIFSHLFNILSKRTNIPSVILLIILGIAIKFGLDFYGINHDKLIFSTLEILGIVGLIKSPSFCRKHMLKSMLLGI